MADVELLIKIPEDIYQKIKGASTIITGRRSGRWFDYIIFNAINTGTLLPNGFGDLFNRIFNRKCAEQEPYKEESEEE